MEKNNYILNIEEFSLYLQAEKIFSEGTILLYKTAVSYTHLTLPTILLV